MDTNMTGFYMVFKSLWFLLLWTKVASLWEGLMGYYIFFFGGGKAVGTMDVQQW